MSHNNLAKDENAMVPILKLKDKAQTLSTRQPQRMVPVLGFTEVLAA